MCFKPLYPYAYEYDSFANTWQLPSAHALEMQITHV